MTKCLYRITAVTWLARPTTSRYLITRKLQLRQMPEWRSLNNEWEEMTETLEIKNLHVAVADKPILNGVNMVIRRGETHALMWPNGSGKSTLAGVIMGQTNYEVSEGSIELNGENIF